MAEENKSTDLALTDDGSSKALTMHSDMDMDSQNPDLDERSSSKFDMAVGDLDLLRQVVLVLSISICVALIVMLFFWVKEPEMRPLGVFETEETDTCTGSFRPAKNQLQIGWQHHFG